MSRSHESETSEDGPMLIGLTGGPMPARTALLDEYLQANHAEIARPGGQNIFRLVPDTLQAAGLRCWAFCRWHSGLLQLLAALLVEEEAADTRLFKGALTLPGHRGRGHMRRLVQWVRWLEGGTHQRAIVRLMPDGQPNAASLSAFQWAGFRIRGEIRHQLRFDAADRHLVQTAEGEDRSYIRALELQAGGPMPGPAAEPGMPA